MTHAALARAHPEPTGRVVILVHGLMDTEHGWHVRGGLDYGTRLGRDTGYLPLWVRYNSGCAIADSGVALSQLLDGLLAAYPAPLHEIVLLGHSLGGLVVRAACHTAAVSRQGGDAADSERGAWLARVQQAYYLGTPHHGAPLERAGRVVARVLGSLDDPYARLARDLADLRSDAVKDLGDADLRHEDRARRRGAASLRDPTHPVPLLATIRHHLVVGSVSEVTWLSQLFGDTIVPVGSASAGHVLHSGADPALLPAHVAYFPGVSHPNLARHEGIYQRIRQWIGGAP